jgi:hypothetical protein
MCTERGKQQINAVAKAKDKCGTVAQLGALHMRSEQLRSPDLEGELQRADEGPEKGNREGGWGGLALIRAG